MLFLKNQKIYEEKVKKYLTKGGKGGRMREPRRKKRQKEAIRRSKKQEE